MVLRNHLGQFITGKTMFLGRVAGPLLAKIIGVYEAVTWLKERLSTTKLTVETDNLLVKQLWKKIWSITLILILLVFDCKTLLKELPFFPSRMLRNQWIGLLIVFLEHLLPCGVPRNSEGVWQMGFAASINVNSTLEAEATSLLMGLQMTAKTKYSNLIDSATENEERAGSYWQILLYNMKCKEKKLYRSRTLPPDMLSNFPENVIDKILMCLPFRDSVRTSILSKKWRYVWRRLPEFMLSHTSWKPKEDLADLTSNFRKIIDRILAFHFGPVIKFTLSIPYFDICPFIDDLIRFLSRNDIQHLVLRLPIRGKPYELPPSLFTCSQLRHLTLPNCLLPHQPAFKEFDRSISLELRDVTISS
ncbi:putative F-box/FBD/LRR-repeat protein-like [Capsicum annuum]|nr:putative F-box/FBD/LRR-repeat protein-like [Capsicum annuum]